MEGGTVRSSLGMYMDTLPLGAPGLADTWMITGTLTPLTPLRTADACTEVGSDSKRFGLRSQKFESSVEC